jgi:hypothetical protein
MILTTPPGGRPLYASAPASCDYAPLCDPEPPPVGDRPARSSGTMETLSGGASLSTWSGDDLSVSDTDSKVQLQLAPDCPVVIGRWEDGSPPYLDTAYRSTRLVPGTGRPVVRSDSEGKDSCVSRAHFMLRGNASGIMVTNGVPRVGGGIRPPMNGTWMVEPSWRLMGPGEEYLIEHGAAVALHLPNGTVLRICAE